MNYLPLKLIKMRKHYNYSQAYLAEVLGVDVLQYMGYENGREMINYLQAKKLASLYHVNVSEILTNSEDVSLYDVSSAKTDEINIEYFLPKETLGTKLKKHPLLMGIAIGAVLIGGVFGFIVLKDNSRPYVSYADNTDRLAVSETSLIYIDNVGAVKGAGDNANGQISNLPSEGAIKVVEGGDFSVILHNDGTLSSYGFLSAYQKEINKLSNIVDIAAGDKHFVAVDNKGKSYCVGDNSKGQCSLDNFSNIKNVYAAENASIGVDQNGQVFYAGSFTGTSSLKNYTGVLDIKSCGENLIILKSDHTCDYVAGKDKSIYSEILRWSNIIDVTCGEDFFAGLKSDGTVEIVSLYLDDETVETWKDIIAIDAGSDYLVGFNGTSVLGIGSNDYHQFDSNETNTKTLSAVKNINIDYDNSKVSIRFDSVNNASGYQVAIILEEGNEITKIVSDNSCTFETSLLKDNNLYNVSVMAIGKGMYSSSKKSLTSFIYLEEVVDVDDEKVKISTAVAGSYRKDFEDYLNKLGVDSIEAIELNEYCSGDFETVKDISGITPGSTYTKSELATREVTYTYCKLRADN